MPRTATLNLAYTLWQDKVWIGSQKQIGVRDSLTLPIITTNACDSQNLHTNKDLSRAEVLI